MSDNLEADIDKMLSLEERAVRALENIAEALAAWIILQQARFDREYPPKREPIDATVTHRPTEEERLRERIFGTEQTTEDWLQPGVREREFESRQNSKRAVKNPKRRNPPSPETDTGTS